MSDSGVTLEDSEAIAAFLDRRLSQDERHALLERMDEDEALYELFVETARFREGRGPGPGRLVEHPAGRTHAAWALPPSIAALLVVAIVAPFLLDEDGALSGDGMVEALVEKAELEPTLVDDWFEHGWRRDRRAAPSRSEVASALRIGVYAVDLEVALRLGRNVDARQLVRRIEFELQGVELSEPLQLSYATLHERLSRGMSIEAALKATAATDHVAVRFLDVGRGYVFGKWAETGRLAARSDNDALLRSRTFRTGLHEAQEVERTDHTHRRLVEISRLIESPAGPDFPALDEAFTRIVDES